MKSLLVLAVAPEQGVLARPETGAGRSKLANVQRHSLGSTRWTFMVGRDRGEGCEGTFDVNLRRPSRLPSQQLSI